MREEFEKLVFAGKIKPEQVDALIALAEVSYCMHKSWGFGRITAIDTVLSKFNIDFVNKPGHALDLGFAADTLEAISPDHILARKMANLEEIQKMAALNHMDLIKLVLKSFGGAASVDKVQEVLVPDVISSDWKKWWDSCKREMKKSGHFKVPSKKSEAITYTESEVTLQQRLLAEFDAAKGLRKKTDVTAEVVKVAGELDDLVGATTHICDSLNKEINSHRRTQPANSLDGVFFRDELRAAAKMEGTEGEATEANIWGQDVSLAAIISKLPAARHRRVLESYLNARPHDWSDAVVLLANDATPKLCGECVNLLVGNGKFGLFKETLARLVSQHQASTDLLLWLAKDRSDTFADIIGPEVFRAMITAIERDIFNEKKSVKLTDYIMKDQELLPTLIESADIEVVKDVTRNVQSTHAFDDMDKRSLLARIVKTFPSVQELISGDSGKEDKTLVVSWVSLKRRQGEYEEIIKVKIPENRKDISIARSYGDLRENHEYKSAKEMQRVLMQRKAELERDLGLARGTDFSDAQTGSVGVGTRIKVTNLNSNEQLDYDILGAWDGDPDAGRLSYLSPLAQKFSGKKVGDEAQYTAGVETTRYRIDSIEKVEPWIMPAEAAAPAPAPATAQDGE
ncbi:MAG: GreA/GreB family elongation factor [Verrucomicrobiae bacterium]|jgi:transcription elongation GreA/GreB family factor|nr:GreA/GreB family elongation factor [Verrucomicrobiae bacterium]